MEELIKKMKLMRKIYLDYKVNFYLISEIDHGYMSLTMCEINDINTPICKMHQSGYITHFSIVTSAEEINSFFNSAKKDIEWKRIIELNGGIEPDFFLDDYPECDYPEETVAEMAWEITFNMVLKIMKNTAISLLEFEGKKIEDIYFINVCAPDAGIILTLDFK